MGGDRILVHKASLLELFASKRLQVKSCLRHFSADVSSVLFRSFYFLAPYPNLYCYVACKSFLIGAETLYLSHRKQNND